ncbi:MAG: SPFH domain-containing protein [Bacillota bacterium]
MNYRTPVSLLFVILALVLIGQSLFVVPQGSWGAVRRMQAPLQVGLAPGLHFKLPLADSALLLDASGITLDGTSLNGGELKFLTADGETVQAGYFALWRITDPAIFCAAEDCDEDAAARRLNESAVAALRDVFKSEKTEAVLANQARLTAGLVERLNPGLAPRGMRIERLDLTGVGLPPAGLEDVYTRMRSALEARAAELRAEGVAAGARSRAATDAERDRVLASADSEAVRIRAAGEAEAAGIEAQASREDPEFFSFYKGLATYRRGLAGQTIWVLDVESPFLKYLKTPPK